MPEDEDKEGDDERRRRDEIFEIHGSGTGGENVKSDLGQWPIPQVSGKINDDITWNMKSAY